jgi:hypothetical protein
MTLEARRQNKRKSAAVPIPSSANEHLLDTERII